MNPLRQAAFGWLVPWRTERVALDMHHDHEHPVETKHKSHTDHKSAVY